MKVIGFLTIKGDTYERRDYGSWQAIVKTHTNGVSIKNEFGGYSPLRTGTAKYITGHWNKLCLSKKC